MPKVNATQLPERIQKRIDELEAGIEVDAKDIRAVLTAEQQAQLAAAWAEQQQLRKAKRATTAAQQQALGWRSKSEVRLEILRQAKDRATGNIVKTFDEELRQADARRNRNYLDTYFAALDAMQDPQQASNQANNALTRAGLGRLDGQTVGRTGLNKRDREILQMEQELMQRTRSEMTADELEQQEILAEHERAVRERRKKRGF